MRSAVAAAGVLTTAASTTESASTDAAATTIRTALRPATPLACTVRPVITGVSVWRVTHNRIRGRGPPLERP